MFDYLLKKPILTSAFAAFLLLIGLLCFLKIPVRLYPTVVHNEITISTFYSGASSETMQNNITDVIEKKLTGLNFIDYMTSENSTGVSKIHLIFKSEVSEKTIKESVISKINSIRNALPKEASAPEMTVSSSPAMILAFTNSNQTQHEMSDYLKTHVKPLLESIEGVQSAAVKGGAYALHIYLNPDKMNALG